MSKLPNMKRPCGNCPFRKDVRAGWLGSERMAEIIGQDSFVCHKTLGKVRQQCAGHMLLNGMDNGFVRLAASLRINLELTGHELVFDSKAACIAHHGPEAA